MLRLTADLDFALAAPQSLAQALTPTAARELTGVADAYQPAKTRFNRLAMEALPDLGVMVRGAEDPLLAAAKCAVAANAIDMGICSNIADDEVRTALRGSPSQKSYTPGGSSSGRLSPVRRTSSTLPTMPGRSPSTAWRSRNSARSE